MMKKLFTLLLVTLLLTLPLGAWAETVVTSFFPITIFTLNLVDGIEGVEVQSLAEPDTGCLHDYQLQTGDMKLLDRADVFLINGAGMESYLTGVFEAFPELPVVDASAGVTLLENCGEEDDHDHSHDHQYNAHIWLDAGNAVIMVQNLADGLAAHLPRHEAAIRDNCEAYTARLTALDAELKEKLGVLERKEIVTFHEAFPYFANAYGLQVAAVVNQEPEDALSPRALAQLVLQIRDLGVPPLFVEPQYEDKAARTIARETGAQVYELDPIVTAPAGEFALTHYEDVMRRNALILTEALGQ